MSSRDFYNGFDPRSPVVRREGDRRHHQLRGCLAADFLATASDTGSSQDFVKM